MESDEPQRSGNGARDHLAAFEFYLERQRYDQALIAAQRYAAMTPDSAEAKAMLAHVLSKLGREEEAQQAVFQAVGLDPESPDALESVALAALKAGRLGEALGAAKEVLRVAPNRADSHAILAAVLARKKDWKGALASIDRALALAPEDEGGMRLRSHILENLGRTSEARSQLDRALAIAPDDAGLLETRGWQAIWANDFDAAAVAFRDALRIDPTDSSVRAGMKAALRGRSPFYRMLVRSISWVHDRGWLGQALLLLGPLGAIILSQELEPHLPHLPSSNGFYLPILLVPAFFLVYLRQFAELHLAFDPMGRTLVTRSSLLGAAATALFVVAGIAGYLGALYWRLFIEFGTATLFLATIVAQSCHFEPRGKYAVLGTSVALFVLQPMMLVVPAKLGMPLLSAEGFAFVMTLWTRVAWLAFLGILLIVMLKNDDSREEPFGVL